MLAFPVFAIAQDAPRPPTAEVLCTPPRQPNFVLDGLAHVGSQETQQLAAEERIEVLVVKPNPFKYSYRVERREVSRPIAITRDFFSGFGFQDALTSLMGAPQARAFAGPPNACTTDNNFTTAQDGYDMKLAAALSLANEVKADVKALGDTLKDYDKFLDDTNVETLGASCIDICGRALRLRDALPKAIDPGMLESKVKSLRAALKELEEIKAAMKAAAANIANTNDRGECEKSLDGVFEQIDALSKAAAIDLPNADKVLETVNKKHDELLHFRQLLVSVLGSTDAFFEYAAVGGSTNRNVKITLIRQDLRTPNSVAQSVGFLSFDVPPSGTEDPTQDPISVSIGFGLSNIDDVKIIRQSGQDGAGGATTVFGFQNNGRYKPGVIGTLNGHLFVYRGITFAASGGFVITNRGDTAQLEYVVGPSFGFAGRHVWLMPALHMARVERLGGGFTPGQPIPDGVQDPLPVQKNTEVGFMIGLTFKVR
jgi:hypothetical protein